MKVITKILAGGVGLAALAGAAPAAAQYYPSPQPSPYGYNSGQGGLGAIIDSILGNRPNRYAYDQRPLVERCIAVVNNEIERRHSRQRTPYGYGGYANARGNARVLGITEVDQRRTGLRVRGIATAGAYAAAPYGSPYGGQYGAPYGGQYGAPYGGQYGAPYGGQYGAPYGGQSGYGYGQPQMQGELTFRCNIDYRGRILDVDIDPNRNAYRYRR